MLKFKNPVFLGSFVLSVSLFMACSGQPQGGAVLPPAPVLPSSPVSSVSTGSRGPHIPAPPPSSAPVARDQSGSSERLVLSPIQSGREFELRVLLSETREDLLRKGENALRSVVSTLRRSRDHVNQNKADLFEAGFRRAQAAIAASHRDGSSRDGLPLHRESIEVLTSVGLENSHLIQVDGFDFNQPTFVYTREWMNYSDRDFIELAYGAGYQVTFANFANNRLGGGWNTHGNVQEEQMAQQCPEFAVILSAFNPGRHQHQLHTRRNPNDPNDQENAKYAHGNGNTADPKLISNLRCFQKLRPDYERDTRRISSQRWSPLNLALLDQPDAPRINMIAMAAPELQQPERNQPYSISLLRDFFNNAYRAFKMVKAYDQQSYARTCLVTGAWGAGAFGHRLDVSLAIQILAARLVFENEDHILFTGLTDDRVQPAHQLVDAVLTHAFTSPEGLATMDQLLVDFQARAQRQGWVAQPVRSRR